MGTIKFTSQTESIIESVYAGLADYQSRHGGNPPEMIMVSYEAFRSLRSKHVKYSTELTMFGIHLHVTDEQGVKIRFCEPSIHIYSKVEANAIRTEREHEPV